MNKKDLESLGLTAEALEKAGLTEDVLKQIIILHGKDIEKFKTDLDAKSAELENAKQQLAEASSTIEKFKGLDIDGIKASADEWKQKYEAAQLDAEKKISEMKFNAALEAALQNAKSKNPKAVKALLDTKTLVMGDDGTISGLKEQLEKIKAENDYLFESEAPEPKVVTGAQSKSVLTDTFTAAARKAAGLPE